MKRTLLLMFLVFCLVFTGTVCAYEGEEDNWFDTFEPEEGMIAITCRELDFVHEFDSDFMESPEFAKEFYELQKMLDDGEITDEDEAYRLCRALWDRGIELMQRYYYNEAAELSTTAECEFDPNTGTIIKILNDAEVLFIPDTIDGIKVLDYEPYILDGKEIVQCIFVPSSLDIDNVIARNCPNLEYIDYFGHHWDIRSHVAQNCPKLTSGIEGINDPTLINHVTSEDYDSLEIYDRDFIHPGKNFAILSQAIVGTDNGYEWDGLLTRAQATTIIVRLLNLENEAYELSTAPCKFADVPQWANGYINVATKYNVVRGVDEYNFDPDRLCSTQDFLTMLFRLTELKEGTDYSWNTVLEDYRHHATTLSKFFHPGYDVEGDVKDFLVAEYYCTPFTRERVTRCLYTMMNIVAGENNKSLGDILAEEYGLSDALMFNAFIRRADPEYPEKNTSFIEYVRNEDEFITQLRPNPNYEHSDEWKAFYAQWTREEREAVTALTQEITEGIATDYEKAKAICVWIATHIFYNQDHLSGAEYADTSPLDVLKSRKTICDGYAKLTEAMFEACGLECYYQRSSTHAWNVAYIDGRILHIDTCWMSKLKYSEGEYHYQTPAGYISEGVFSKGEKVVVTGDDIFEPGTTEYSEEYFDMHFMKFYSLPYHQLLQQPTDKAIETKKEYDYH